MDFENKLKAAVSNTTSPLGTIVNKSLDLTHRCYTVKDAKSIQKKGFNLKRCGTTAKLYGAPDFLVKYDPICVFACVDKDVSQPDSYAVVKFSIRDANVLEYSGMTPTAFKKAMYEHFDVSSVQELTGKLKELGVDAVMSPDKDNAGMEVLVINTDKIGITYAGYQLDAPTKKVGLKPVGVS